MGEHIIGTDIRDQISGNDGNDTINGRGGDDTLNGNDGNDTLYAYGGRDVLIGGAGADVFGFSANLFSYRARILDFNVAEDAQQFNLAGVTSAQDMYDIFIATATEAGITVRFVSAEGFFINLDNLTLADLTVANFVYDPSLPLYWYSPRAGGPPGCTKPVLRPRFLVQHTDSADQNQGSIWPIWPKKNAGTKPALSY